MANLSNISSRPGRRRTLTVAGLLLLPSALLVGTNIAGAADDDPVDDSTVAETSSEISTVEVQQRDLSVDYEANGTIEAASTIDVGSPTGGRVLAAAEPGSVVASGTVIARVDDRAIVALSGATPMWRDLSVGDIGVDVNQLETALVDLGFDPDGNVTVDDEYTSATATMVRDWQTALDVDSNGSVLQSDVVMIPEQMRVSSVVGDVGASVAADEPIVVVETEAQIITSEVVVADAVTLAVADPVTVRLPDRTELVGTVQSIGRGTDTAVRSLIIEFDDNSESPAYGGTTVTVAWDIALAVDALTLPADTLRRLETGIYVADVIGENGSISPVEVQVGTSVGSLVEVFGLAEDTSVARP